MAGLRRALRARKRFTRFTPRASSARTICDGSKRKPRPLFRRRSHAAPEQRPAAKPREEPFMSSPAFSNRPSGHRYVGCSHDLALDLRWSFNHSADELWERLDPELWEQTHNPWVVLQTASRERLQSVTADPNFQKLLTDLHRGKETARASRKAGFKRHILIPVFRRLPISPWSSC